MAVLKNPVDFRYQPEHEHPFPAEVSGGSNAGMSQKLVGSLYDPVPQSMRDIEAVARSLVLVAPKAPQPRGGVLL